MSVELKNAAIGFKESLAEYINMRIEPAETVLLTGPNGSGKTTLGLSIIGIRKLLAGSLIFNFRRPAYVPQNEHLDMQYPLTLAELVEQGNPARYSISELLRATGLSHNEGSLLLREASGGQRQRALISRALASEPDFILMDEPFSNLDREGRELLSELVEKLKQSNTAVLIIDHPVQKSSFYTQIFELYNRELKVKS